MRHDRCDRISLTWNQNTLSLICDRAWVGIYVRQKEEANSLRKQLVAAQTGADDKTARQEEEANILRTQLTAAQAAVDTEKRILENEVDALRGQLLASRESESPGPPHNRIRQTRANNADSAVIPDAPQNNKRRRIRARKAQAFTAHGKQSQKKKLPGTDQRTTLLLHKKLS
jgi:hypothetical protein